MGDRLIDLTEGKGFRHGFNVMAGSKVQHFSRRGRATERATRECLLAQDQRECLHLDRIGHHPNKVESAFGPQGIDGESPVQVCIVAVRSPILGSGSYSYLTLKG